VNRIKEKILSEKMIVVYVKSDGCSVCEPLFEKVSNLCKVKNIPIEKLDVIEDREFVAQESLFSAPMILFYVEGKLVIKEGRFLRLDELERQIHRYLEII